MHSHKTNIRLKIMHKLFELFRKDNKTSNPPPFFLGKWGKRSHITLETLGKMLLSAITKILF